MWRTYSSVKSDFTEELLLIHKTSKNSAVWHFTAAGRKEVLAPISRGSTKWNTLMEGDLEIINGIRDAFVLWPSNPVSGILSYKNNCTRVTCLTYKVFQFDVVCLCSAAYYLCAVSVKWWLLKVYFPFPSWSQKVGQGPRGNSSDFDGCLSPFEGLYLHWRVYR